MKSRLHANPPRQFQNQNAETAECKENKKLELTFMNRCENPSDSNIACFFSSIKLFSSPGIICKVHIFFVILRECETGCFLIWWGNLGREQRSSVSSHRISEDTARDFSRKSLELIKPLQDRFLRD
jgi:hypothetical protein